MLLYWVWFSELNTPIFEKHRLLSQYKDPESLYHSAQLTPEEKELTAAEAILKECNQDLLVELILKMK